jgi:hypothetical protein
MESTIGNNCRGDSGSPILSITATQVTLIGINTGGIFKKNCSELQNGKYYGLFTLIGRYANLAFSSASYTMNVLNQQYESALGENVSVKSQLASAKNSISEVTVQLNDTKTLLDNANSSKEAVQKQLETSQKASSALTAKLKKICAVKPKPKGC